MSFKSIILFFTGLLMPYKPERILNNPDLIKKSAKRCKTMVHILPFIPFKAYILKSSKLINRFMINNKKEKEVYRFFIECFHKFDDYYKFFLSKYMYLSNIFDDEICKEIIEFAKETKSKEYRYWTTMDISKMTFFSQKGFYDNYYNDRKELLKKIAIEMDLDIPKKYNKNSNESRLCIITYLLDDSIANSSQRVVSMLANGLASEFDRVLVITLDSFYVSKSEKKSITTLFERKLSYKMKQKINDLFNDKIEIYYQNDRTYKDRYKNALITIYSFNPDIIIDMSDEYSAISYFYSQDFTTLYLPMRNHASSSFFSYIVGRKWCFEENKRYNCIDSSQIVEWTFPEYIPDKTESYIRSDYGINNDSFVITTVGNNESSCDPEFIDCVAELLYEHSNFIWILVGSPAPLYFHEKYKDLLCNRRVIEWGYEKNLYAFYGLCDVLLRPNTTGGSGAVAIAAMRGLPIAMTNFLCDAMRWLGDDFSKINNYNELMQYIVNLYDNKEFYYEQSNISYAKVHEATDAEKKWQELAYIIKKESRMINE